MQCYNATIEWIDCEMLALIIKCRAVYTRAISTNAMYILGVCNLNPGVFIHLNAVQNCIFFRFVVRPR